MNTNYTNENVKAIIKNEGLLYAVKDFMDESEIKDPVLKLHWMVARKRITEFEKEALKYTQPGYLILSPEKGFRVIEDIKGQYQELTLGQLPVELKNKIGEIAITLQRILWRLAIEATTQMRMVSPAQK